MEHSRAFKQSKANYSKLPHQLIEQFPNINSLSELKVIIYVLRHTWGFDDEFKRITLDEFQNGRRRKDRSRIDGGIGMTRQSVLNGIKRAIADGYLFEVRDESDKARVRKYYSLTESGIELAPRYGGSKNHTPTDREGSKNHTSGVQKLDPDQRKKLLERKKKEREEGTPAPAKQKKGIEYPPHLDTPGFREVWLEFEAYKRGNRKPLSVVGRKRLLTKAAKYGVDDVIWLLNLCMDTGWAGIIWDRLDKRIADKERDGFDYRKDIRKAIASFGRDRYEDAALAMPSVASFVAGNMGNWSDVCSMNEYQFEQAYRRAMKMGG